MSDSHLVIEPADELISITVDRTTADYLRYAIAVLGEHIAGGMEVPPMSADMATRLGGLLRGLEATLQR